VGRQDKNDYHPKDSDKKKYIITNKSKDTIFIYALALLTPFGI
jgi:hypothetical protein